MSPLLHANEVAPLKQRPKGDQWWVWAGPALAKKAVGGGWQSKAQNLYIFLYLTWLYDLEPGSALPWISMGLLNKVCIIKTLGGRHWQSNLATRSLVIFFPSQTKKRLGFCRSRVGSGSLVRKKHQENKLPRGSNDQPGLETNGAVEGQAQTTVVLQQCDWGVSALGRSF